MASRLVVAVLIVAATSARADDVIPGHAIDRSLDSAVVAGALGAAFGLSLIPVRPPSVLWQRELFGVVDGAVHASFSPRASQLSDVILAGTIAGPIAYLTGSTIDDADGDRLQLYSEALAINLALFEGAKRLVQRPRPYLYSDVPGVAAYAASQGDDAFQSFYSAHAATAFCAATASAYLIGTGSTSGTVRSLAWGSGFAAASAVANLRVRAGKHFYSDVVIGALVGIAIGYAVPALHADARPYVPRTGEIAAALAGVLGGGLLSELVPLERAGSLGEPRHALAQRSVLRALRSHAVRLGPTSVPGGAGVGIGGAL
jgi:membrane-associated phospholipid phosphatase